MEITYALLTTIIIMLFVLIILIKQITISIIRLYCNLNKLQDIIIDIHPNYKI